MHRVIERLGVPIKIMGFDSESVMVNNLAATPRTLTQTCFAHGAGKYRRLTKEGPWAVHLTLGSDRGVGRHLQHQYYNYM